MRSVFSWTLAVSCPTARPNPRFTRARLSRSQKSRMALGRVSCRCDGNAVRVGHQQQDCEGTRTHNPTVAACRCRRGDRAKRRDFISLLGGAAAFVAAVVAGAASSPRLRCCTPLEYVAMNALTGGTRGAYDKFELDYWSAAATEAVQPLEHMIHPFGWPKRRRASWFVSARARRGFIRFCDGPGSWKPIRTRPISSSRRSGRVVRRTSPSS